MTPAAGAGVGEAVVVPRGGRRAVVGSALGVGVGVADVEGVGVALVLGGVGGTVAWANSSTPVGATTVVSIPADVELGGDGLGDLHVGRALGGGPDDQLHRLARGPATGRRRRGSSPPR